MPVIYPEEPTFVSSVLISVLSPLLVHFGYFSFEMSSSVIFPTSNFPLFSLIFR